MKNKFIYSPKKSLFEKKLAAGEIGEESIVFIEDTKEIWNRGHYFGLVGSGSGIDPEVLSGIETAIATLQSDKADKSELSDYAKKDELPSLDEYLTKTVADGLYATIAQYNDLNQTVGDIQTELSNKATKDELSTGLAGKLDNSAADGFVPTTRKVNGKALDQDITITATDPNAATKEELSGVNTDLQTFKNNVALTYATDQDVADAVAALVDSSPTTLNTLNELAAALGDDPNFATTVATQIGTKADQTALDTTNTNVANIAESLSSYLPLSGGTLTQTKNATSLLFVNTTYDPYISFQKGNSVLGHIKVLADSVVYVKQSDGSFNTLLHSGNIGEYKAGDSALLGGIDANRYTVLDTYYYTNNADANNLTRAGFYINVTGNGSGNSHFPGTYGKLFSWGGTYGFAQMHADVLYGTLSFRCGASTLENRPWKTIAFTDSDITGNAAGLKHSNGTIGAVVNSSGNVAIGGSDLASTNYKLFVHGGLLATTTRTQELRLGESVNGSATADNKWYYASIGYEYEQESPQTLDPAIVFKTMYNTYAEGTGVERMRITAGGNVLIGTATDLGTKLHVEGNTTITGTCSASSGFFETSDERLKDFTKDIDVDFEKLKSIPKKYFTWKNDEEKVLQLGTSAQAVQEVFPELVSGKDPLSVNYSKLVIPALAAIDKLYEENQVLKDRLTYLENKLNG